MSKSLEKEYYKLSSSEFNCLLDTLRNNPDTIHIFKEDPHPFFYLQNNEISKRLLQLHKDQWEFDQLISSFSEFARNQIIQSFLIDEVRSTNSIENIPSTRHDIFCLINRLPGSTDKKIRSIVNAYVLLTHLNGERITNLENLRSVYDSLMEDAIEKQDLPDGKLFRKDPVYISNGIENIHIGFYPEEKIINGMEEFLQLYNDESRDPYERAILSHFILETVHPFYDGNGRFGRYLFSAELGGSEKTNLSFIVSKVIERRKSMYYKILENGRKEREFGSLILFVSDFCDLLHQGFQEEIGELKNKKERIDRCGSDLKSFHKSEIRILSLLKEASVLSDFGICNQEIIKYASVSKRTLITVMNRLREKDLLDDTIFGKTAFHKLKSAE